MEEARSKKTIKTQTRCNYPRSQFIQVERRDHVMGATNTLEEKPKVLDERQSGQLLTCDGTVSFSSYGWDGTLLAKIPTELSPLITSQLRVARRK